MSLFANSQNLSLRSTLVREAKGIDFRRKKVCMGRGESGLGPRSRMVMRVRVQVRGPLVRVAGSGLQMHHFKKLLGRVLEGGEGGSGPRPGPEMHDFKSFAGVVVRVWDRVRVWKCSI